MRDELRKVAEEQIVYQDFLTDDGDRYNVLTKTYKAIPQRSGLSEVIMALLAFSTTGIVIYLSWFTVISITTKSVAGPPRPVTISAQENP